MQRAPTRRTPLALDLFHPPRQEPDWQSLPTAVRERTVKRLVQMLREAHRQALSTENSKEAGDE